MGDDLVHAGGAANGGGGAAIVPREHDYPQPHSLELGDGGDAVFPQGVRYGDQTERDTLPGEKEGRLALFGEGVGGFCQRRREDGLAAHKGAAAAPKALSFYDGGQPVARERLKVCPFREGERPFPGSLPDGLG